MQTADTKLIKGKNLTGACKSERQQIRGNLLNMSREDTVRVVGKMTPDMVRHHAQHMRLRTPSFC